MPSRRQSLFAVSFPVSGAPDAKNAGGNSALASDLQQLREAMLQFKQEVCQMKQNYYTNTERREQTGLDHERFREFDHYFPWNNLSLVLMKKNFKKMKRIQNIKAKKQSYLQNEFTAKRSLRSIAHRSVHEKE